MTQTRKSASPGASAPAGERTRSRKATQPPATGAKRASPAAPAMQQFAKTRTERGGRT